MREGELWIIALLLVLLVIVTYGFQEVFARLRPRVYYVHRGGKGEGEPADDVA